MTPTERRLIDEIRYAASALEVASAALLAAGEGVHAANATSASAHALAIAELAEEGNLGKRQEFYGVQPPMEGVCPTA